MKYLYKILRLFFCPHKYKMYDSARVGSLTETHAWRYTTQCKYCGKVKVTVKYN